MKNSVAVLAALLALLVLPAGCAGLMDPYQREGTWKPTGINDANLKQMLVTPSDFEHGTGTSDSIGTTATLAVARFRNDTTKPLPETQFGPAAGGGGNGSTAAASNSGGAQ